MLRVMQEPLVKHPGDHSPDRSTQDPSSYDIGHIVSADIHAGEPDRRNKRPTDPAGLRVQDLKESRRGCRVHCMIGWKRKSPPTAQQLRDSLEAETGTRPLDEILNLCADRIGTGDYGG